MADASFVPEHRKNAYDVLYASRGRRQEPVCDPYWVELDPEMSLEDLILDPYMDFDEVLDENEIRHNDRRMDEVEEYFQTRFWEHRGMLDDWSESSYLLGCSPHESDPLNRKVDYECCTPSELKRMVIGRGLNDPFPEGVTLKYYYLKLLDKADKEWQFRFMDLPPEMRLIAYRELLTFPGPRFGVWYYNTVYPQILRTSKQINTEASDILYHDNIFEASYQITTLVNQDIKRDLRVHNKRQSALCPHMPNTRLPSGIDQYPEFFRRISNLEIELEYMRDPTKAHAREQAYSLNHFVATLASSLMDGHMLKTIIVKFNGHSNLEDWYYSMVLYPLRRVRNISKVVFKGHVPNHIQRKLIHDMTSTEPVSNTMRQWKLLEDEAHAQFAVLETLHDDMGCSCGECPMPECMMEFTGMMENIHGISERAFSSSVLEEHFTARLAYLRQALHKVDLNDLKAFVNALIAKRKSLQGYEAVTDDGRLGEAAEIWKGKTYGDALKMDTDLTEDWSDDTSEADADGATMHESDAASASSERGLLNSEEVEQMLDFLVDGGAPRASPEL